MHENLLIDILGYLYYTYFVETSMVEYADAGNAALIHYLYKEIHREDLEANWKLLSNGKQLFHIKCRKVPVTFRRVFLR